jgi:hypothetical protein
MKASQNRKMPFLWSNIDFISSFFIIDPWPGQPRFAMEGCEFVNIS